MKLKSLLISIFGIFFSPTCNESKQIINDPQRLHDIWNLSALNGKKIKQIPIRPTLEINLSERKIMGTDGCNQYFGPIDKLEGNLINFGLLASTKKLCPNMEFIDEFNMALKRVESYQLDGLNLILRNAEGKETLKFLKGD